MLGYDAHVHEVRSGVSGDVTALTEVPHFCSLKIPTLGRSAA